MKILMFTNTYLPHVGGVARSVQAFTEFFRRNGHDVLVVCPKFDEAGDDDPYVIRTPAIQNFNGSDFSVSLPFHPGLEQSVCDFAPDVIHSHHPFLLGDTALRFAGILNRPLVFTYHTMYENYTHYVPADSDLLKELAIELAKGYCMLCDHVIAPSESIVDILRERDIPTPLSAIPTGIDPDRFSSGDGQRLRKAKGWGNHTFVVGHVGRLAEEKNLRPLSEAVARFLETEPEAVALIVGRGDMEEGIRSIFTSRGLGQRLVMPGSLTGPALADAYHAMDVFVFASQTETQGMVLTEAMSAGVPVVAHDAPGAREVVRDGGNGRLLEDKTVDSLVHGIEWVHGLSTEQHDDLRESARQTADAFSLDRCGKRVLGVYEEARRSCASRRERDPDQMTLLKDRFKVELDVWQKRLVALRAAAGGEA